MHGSARMYTVVTHLVAIVASLLLLGAVVHGQTLPPPSRQDPRIRVWAEQQAAREQWVQNQRWRDRTGPEVALHVGVGSHLDDSSTAFTTVRRAQDHWFWPGLALDLTGGHRLLPSFSLGVHANYQHRPSRDLPVGTYDGVLHHLAAGVYARFYAGTALRFRSRGLAGLEPWLSAGIDPIAALWTFHRTSAGTQRTRILAYAFPMVFALDFDVSPHVSLGLQTQISPWIPWQYCTHPPAGPSTCIGENSLEPNVYLFAGIGMRLTFPS